ncbi:MAG: (4Fe-4S)-binding protein, partial [Deltaproteobacteria bacterium]|nr:(4Fe-4S)-binding protein [Deltaproteobacteria bacterium]
TGGILVHAELGVAEDNSGKLVSEVRKVARAEAERLRAEIIFLDGPPGIGCPVHASLNNVELAVIVTEPSASGISDFERILQLCEHFGIPVAVIINKSDLAPMLTEKIMQRCMAHDIPILGVIPFSREVPKALSNGKTLLEVPDVLPVITRIHKQLKDMVSRVG